MLIERLNLNQGLTDERRNFYFSPSRAGGCQRAMFFEANGYEPDEESVNMHIFEDGKVHEDLTIKFLEANNVEIFDRQKDVNIEIPLQYRDKITLLQVGICPICQNVIPKHSIHGHIDVLFRDEDSSVGLFEHKAVNSDTMKKYKKNGVWEGYMKQLALYMRGLELEKGVVYIIKFRGESKCHTRPILNPFSSSIHISPSKSVGSPRRHSHLLFFQWTKVVDYQYQI